MMALKNTLNVYTGPNAVQEYFDPNMHPPLPLVEVPQTLNPYYVDGVRIFAKMMSMHPANNVKIMPAMNMLRKDFKPARTRTVIEYSSGSTAISLALASRVYHGVTDCRAFLSNKTTKSKLRLMQFFGLDITLFGGPSQPEPIDQRGGIYRAQRLAEANDQYLNANQYQNDGNWQAHVKWTGPQIHEQLPRINLICAGLGTSGTMTGLGQYFKAAKPSVIRLGVCTAPGDRVPGPRSYALLSPVEFPWRDSVDSIEEVDSRNAFSMSLQLCREGLVCGPSSGFNLQGLLNYIGKRKAGETLSQLAGADGLVNCVFICCDLPYQYLDEYFEKVDNNVFHPIQHENLAAVDLYRYDEAWELQPTEAMTHYSRKDSHNVIIDLRKPDDFIASNIPGSYNLPLHSLNHTTPSPFFDAAVLEHQWRELDQTLCHNTISAYKLADKDVGVICYDGDTARIATSVLRAKGIAANSIRGGFHALKTQFPQQCTGLESFKWSEMPDDTSQGLGGDPAPSKGGTRREVLVDAV